MTGALEEKHLESIEDYVLVEDKIVTYKWISKVLQIHVNTAKRLLHAFALKKEFKEKLLVIYLIIGEAKDDSGYQICLVTKNDVNEVKQKFDKIVSEHIYSIQRRSEFNENDLYNADCTYELNEEDKKFSSIRKNEDIKKICSDKGTRTITSSVNISNTLLKNPEKALINGNKNIDESEIVNNTKSSEPNHKVPKEKCPTPSKESTSKTSTKSTAIVKGKKSPKKLKNTVSQGGIGTFFNKQVNVAQKERDQSAVTTSKLDEDEIKENIVVQVSKKSEYDVIPSTNGKETTLHNKTKVNSKKRKKHAKETETSNKRRKRIMVASDSENSDDDMELDEKRELSPEPEPVVLLQEESDEEIIPPTPIDKGRKRIRKQIDKTFTDEDGFILTKKEYVYESCSDDEAPVAQLSAIKDKEIEPLNKTKTQDNNEIKSDNGKKKKKSKSPKKSTKPQQQQCKQQSITNFFTKK